MTYPTKPQLAILAHVRACGQVKIRHIPGARMDTIHRCVERGWLKMGCLQRDRDELVWLDTAGYDVLDEMGVRYI